MRESSIYRVSDKFKGKLPAWIFLLLKRIGTTLLTPIFFSFQTGHFLSSLKLRAVDKNGKPTLWYTFPMTEFLQFKDYRDKQVLEFGGGQSTLWWANRAKEVVTFDVSPKWVKYLREKAPSNVTVHRVAWEGIKDAENQVKDRLFDIIIIDSLNRFKCVICSLDRLKEGGAIIFDDSDGPWTAQFPIIELFRKSGFSRIDFYGYAPGVFSPHCTSLFFKDYCFLFDGSIDPVSKVS